MNKHKIVRVTEVGPQDGLRLALTFDDGTTGLADVSKLLVGPVFEQIRQSETLFAQVDLDGYGSIAWPNGADLDAWVLYELTVAETAAS